MLIRRLCLVGISYPRTVALQLFPHFLGLSIRLSVVAYDTYRLNANRDYAPIIAKCSFPAVRNLRFEGPGFVSLSRLMQAARLHQNGGCACAKAKEGWKPSPAAAAKFDNAACANRFIPSRLRPFRSYMRRERSHGRNQRAGATLREFSAWMLTVP